MIERKGGDCRSEGLLRLINRKGAGFRFLITPVGVFQKVSLRLLHRMLIGKCRR